MLDACNVPLSEMTKFPYLLPSKHPLTNLIINMAQFHGGVNSVITVLRQQYWIPKFHQVVRSLLGNVLLTKRSQGSHIVHLHCPNQEHCTLHHLVQHGGLYRSLTAWIRNRRYTYVCLLVPIQGQYTWKLSQP